MTWPDNYKNLISWWQTSQGQAYLTFEKALLKKRLSNVFGYQLVVLGNAEFSDYGISSRLLNYTRLDPLDEPSTKLPRDIDVLVLPHWLYYFPHCQPLLTELNHSMINGGLLLITGYNYASMLGWQWYWQRTCQRFSYDTKKYPIPTSLIRPKELKKLLLNDQFAVNSMRKYGSITQPAQSDTIKPNGYGWLSMIEATKNIAIVKRIKPSWQPQTKSLRQTIASPFIESGSHDH